MRRPKISVGMPVFNAQRYLRQAIESVLSQTMADLELILSDNASTDATSDICRQYAARDRRVKYHRNGRNLGVVANFNRAFALSRGSYFKWAAYDDLHAPTYLQKCAAALDADPSLAVAHSLTLSIDEDGRPRGEFPATHRLDAADPVERFRRMVWTDAFPPIWGLMRSTFIRRTRLHEPYMGSDRNFLAEMLLMGGVAYVDEPLFLLREHGASYTASVKDYYQRLSWYAPRRRIPSWFQVPRTAVGYFTTIARAPISWRQRLACARVVMGWLGACARGLIARRAAPLVAAVEGAVAEVLPHRTHKGPSTQRAELGGVV